MLNAIKIYMTADVRTLHSFPWFHRFLNEFSLKFSLDSMKSTEFYSNFSISRQLTQIHVQKHNFYSLFFLKTDKSYLPFFLFIPRFYPK